MFILIIFYYLFLFFFFFSSRRRHTRLVSDWSSDVCSSDLHHVSRLSLSTVEEKTEVIRNLDYPRNLRDLETGLGFFGYYRKFIPHYSAIAQSLLDLKMTGFKTSPSRGQAQIKHAELTKYLEDGTFPTDCKAA